MFPVDLLLAVGESLLERLSVLVAKAACAARRDTRRRFAHDLFAYYENLEEYARTCDELADLMERLIPSHPRHGYSVWDVDNANRLAESPVRPNG
jgi:hypothetical protein